MEIETTFAAIHMREHGTKGRARCGAIAGATTMGVLRQVSGDAKWVPGSSQVP